GHPQYGLFGGGVRGLRPRGVVADGPDGALELLLGDLDDLRRQAGGVGEGEHGCLVADEQDGAGALLLGMALGATGGAVVTARGGLSGEQAGCFFVADLGAYLVADVEHARHGWLPRDGCVARPGGSRPVVRVAPRLMKKTTGDPWRESRPRANGFEPSGAPAHVRRATRNSSSTYFDRTVVEGARCLRRSSAPWPTNPEIRE